MSVAGHGQRGMVWDAVVAQPLIDRHANERGGLLPLLHTLQHAFGHIPEEAIPMVAHALNLSRADVYGVISFYQDYRRSAPGRHIVRLCRAEACRAVGANDLAHHAERVLGVGFGETRKDRQVTLEAIACFGNCALGPTVEVDGVLNGCVTLDDFDALLDDIGLGVKDLAS